MQQPAHVVLISLSSFLVCIIPLLLPLVDGSPRPPENPPPPRPLPPIASLPQTTSSAPGSTCCPPSPAATSGTGAGAAVPPRPFHCPLTLPSPRPGLVVTTAADRPAYIFLLHLLILLLLELHVHLLLPVLTPPSSAATAAAASALLNTNISRAGPYRHHKQTGYPYPSDSHRFWASRIYPPPLQRNCIAESWSRSTQGR